MINHQQTRRFLMPTLLTTLKTKKIEDIKLLAFKALKAGFNSEIAGLDIDTGKVYAYKRTECLNNRKIKTITQILSTYQRNKQSKHLQFKKPQKSKNFFTFADIFKVLSDDKKPTSRAEASPIASASPYELSQMRNEFSSLSLA